MEAVLSAPRWPEKPRNLAPSFVLALAMHALLFLGFSIAVQWRTEPQAAAVAELWEALPPIEVPPARPQPRPEPEPPRVEPTPQPAPTEAEIALEQERKRREQERLESERRKLEEERLKREAEQRRAAEEARKKQEAEARRRAEEEKRLAAEREAFRREVEQRMLAQVEPKAGAQGGSAGAASAGRGTDATYAAAVVACIRPHIAFAVPEGTPPSVAAEFRVELLPDASVASVTLLKPSGLPGYDAAAERAIRRCDPFPRKRDGTIDRTILVVLRPVETR